MRGMHCNEADWEDIGKEAAELKTEYYDADQNKDVLDKYNVKDVPTFIFLDNAGNEIPRLKGPQNKEDLLKLVKENINK